MFSAELIVVLPADPISTSALAEMSERSRFATADRVLLAEIVEAVASDSDTLPFISRFPRVRPATASRHAAVNCGRHEGGDPRARRTGVFEAMLDEAHRCCR